MIILILLCCLGYIREYSSSCNFALNTKCFFSSLTVCLWLMHFAYAVQAYKEIADGYRVITKACYDFLLFLGIGITFIAINQSYEYAQYGVIFLSFVSTVVAAYVSFMNPAVRWQQVPVIHEL